MARNTLPDGTWTVDDRNPELHVHKWYSKVDGKRHTVRARTQIEARHKRNAVEAELIGDEAVAAATAVKGGATVAELATAFLAHQRGLGLAAKTVSLYEWTMRQVIDTLGDVPLADFNWKHINAMLTDSAKHLGKSSLSKIRMHLHGMCSFGFMQQDDHRLHLASNPFAAAKIVTPKTRKRQPVVTRWFKTPDYLKVRAYLIDNPSPVHTLYLVMLDAGLRPGEAYGLHWSRVDFDARTLTVDFGVRTEDDGRRRPSSTLKTDHHAEDGMSCAHRTIGMTKELSAALRGERARQNESRLARGGERMWDDFVFFGKLTEGKARREWSKIAAAAGVPPVRPNGYRHTFASACRESGAIYDKIAPLMGHQDTVMLTKVYGHRMADLTADDMDRMLG